MRVLLPLLVVISFVLTSRISMAEPASQAPPVGAIEEGYKNIPEETTEQIDGKTITAHPRFMKRFADKVYHFFELEPQIRETALEIVASGNFTRKADQPGYDPIMAYFKLIEAKSGIDYMKYFAGDEKYEETLNHDERYAVDKTFQGLMFYLVQLPGEEGIKAGIIPPSDRHESETPEVLKGYIKGILLPYKKGVIASEEETRKDIERVWSAMRSALLAGDVEGAVKYFSSETRQGYRASFTELAKAGLLSKMAADMGDMKVVNVRADSAEGDLRSKEKGKEFSYYVQFVMEEDGWKIRSY